MNPLVSIVTPSFNQGEFLEQTILSVLNQTYPNIEYIIIDGGSKDGSVSIIKKYSQQLKFWVSEKDRGQAHALNKGFERASGDLFAYLNADDLYEPDAIAGIVEAFIRKPHCALIYGKCSTIDASGEPLSCPMGESISYPDLLINKMLPKIYQPACFFNSRFLLRTPLFREDLNYVMDYDLILSLMRKHPYQFIDHPVARFRIHQRSKSVSDPTNMYAEKLRIQFAHAPWLLPLWAWRYLKYRLHRNKIKNLLHPGS